MRQARGARRNNERVTLTYAEVIVDDYGHRQMGTPVPVLSVYASVEQMSATKSMMTFQQADVVGLDIEMRQPPVEFNGLVWRGHAVVFASPVQTGKLCRDIRLSGYYQIDNPLNNG